MKEYYVKNAVKRGEWAFLVSDNPEAWEAETNYLVFEYLRSLIYIHDLEASGAGRGTVLLARTMEEARDRGVSQVTAIFQPRIIRGLQHDEVRTRAQRWYERRGIVLEGIDELTGNVDNVLALCTIILAQHQTKIVRV